MSFSVAFMLLLLVVVLTALMLDWLSPDAVLVAGLLATIVAGIIPLERAMRGFGNSTLLALGSLYVVAAGLRETGALDRASNFILGSTPDVQRILLRMCPSVTVYSAFLNNTPVVAMGIPAIRSWCRRNDVSPSKLLMPLSFAAILGGINTLVGTSTNLVVHGLLQSHNMAGFGFFELAWLGVPCAVVGLFYVIFFVPYLTPDRTDIREQEEEERAELVEVELTADSPYIGQSVEEADLEFVPGFALVQIERGNRFIAPVEHDETIKPGDRLFFAERDVVRSLEDDTNGTPVPDEQLDLDPYPGLRLALTDVERAAEDERELHQVVIREGSSLIGETVGEVKFPERFGAAVTGLRRKGERFEGPLTDVELRPGDTLLLDTEREFRETFEESEEFFITSEEGGEATEESVAPRRFGGWRLWLSGAVIVAIVGLVASGLANIAVAGPLGALVIVAAGILTPGQAREAVDWNVLIVIGAALGLGQALEASGAARLLGEGIVDVMKAYGPRAVLAGVTISTMILTQLITNNGAVALMFPIVLSISQTLGFDTRALMISMTLMGSMAFITPIGYQTNLMVYGPGGYKFSDFIRIGGILQIILLIVVIVLAPIIWPMR
ncbi:SLC13 family permease [Salisaeta longa]|uniref:SLC13 family permease n=1 Tax=Salisaeta longa TaxID=503170 RepID=UPI0003B482FE|nr:SLC13 family permease [Salisaeta longa]